MPSPATGTARLVREVADLSVLFADDVNVVALSRPLESGLLEQVQSVLARPCFRVMTPLTPSQGVAELQARMPDLPRLAAEVHFWSEVLADLTGCEQVGVRLARVESAMCPRFHVDQLTVRVVSTFWGSGTEYLVEEDVDRRWLGHAAPGVEGEARGVLRAGARVRRAQAGDVLLLKGEAWPGNAGRGAVHRSPPASADAPRLVLTLDPLVR
jgi:Protein of unknown function (DUF1826)